MTSPIGSQASSLTPSARVSPATGNLNVNESHREPTSSIMGKVPTPPQATHTEKQNPRQVFFRPTPPQHAITPPSSSIRTPESEALTPASDDLTPEHSERSLTCVQLQRKRLMELDRKRAVPLEAGRLPEIKKSSKTPLADKVNIRSIVVETNEREMNAELNTKNMENRNVPKLTKNVNNELKKILKNLEIAYHGADKILVTVISDIPMDYAVQILAIPRSTNVDQETKSYEVKLPTYFPKRILESLALSMEMMPVQYSEQQFSVCHNDKYTRDEIGLEQI